jgi:regulator of sigma E protease
MIFHRLLTAITAINLLDLLITIAAFIVLIGIMVVVHEFGHFAVAKLCGVRVEAFSFGFGPRLFGYKYGDTDYKVCAFPLGGYVKMSGEQFSELSDAAAGTATIAPVTDPGALTSHPRWQQMLIGVAGPAANFVLAFVLMAFYFNFINEVPSINPIIVEWVTEGSSAAQAGIQPGDIVRRFDQAGNPTWNQIENISRQKVNHTVPIMVERNGKILPLTLHISSQSKGSQFYLGDTGLFLQLLHNPIGVESVIHDSPAEHAGLRGGDLILAVDGHTFHSVDPILYNYLKSGQGRPITLTISRNGQTIAPIVVHPSLQGSVWRIGFMSAASTEEIPTLHEQMPFSQAVQESKEFCIENSTMILDMVGRLVSRKVAVSQLSGPVGIAEIAGRAAKTKDWSSKFGFAASISLNLGILNLLPFPILDGGMILFLLIEGAIRREISINVKERIYQAAFFLLIILFVYIMFNDIVRTSFVEHLMNP